MTEVHLDPQAGAEPPGGAEAIGLELRRAREARGETPGDVALALKLTGRQVEAMEAGRLELLPGAAFARGFLRNYARYLGFDPIALLAGLDPEKAPRPVELAPMSNAEGIMPTGGGARAVRIPAVLSGIALLMLIGGWYFDWFRMPTESEAIVESTAPTPQIITPSTPDGASPAAPADVPPAAPAATPAVPLPPGAITAVPPGPVPPVVPPAPAVVAPAAPAAPSAPVAPAAATPVAHADGLQQLVFRFQGDAWVEVRDASGSIVFSGTNQAGSSRTVQGRPPFALVVGNARQVVLEYRGKPYDLLPHIRVSVARLTLE
ncbi:MAG TPA: helix-turn-helix domain-containing protein [Aromatoleum sp.]|uniref:helix-turn-helix domain-containing protein n=1 Tax=Aromatoleum sp. TaxID=2307007 RepID=UPI002B4A231A|nr:helix-turn-helix domain-containing protein [Aromatoleum sp.]HJV27016.1 helix-turn-helix domain-containing protein [Aromatoleum sp.]